MTTPSFSSRSPRTAPRALASAVLSAACLLIAGVPVPTGAAEAGIESRVAEVHRAAFPLDAHVDVLLPDTPRRYRTVDGGSHAGPDALARGGIATVVYAVAVSTGPETPDAVAQARATADRKLAAIRELVAEHPDRLALAYGTGDVERIRAAGRTAVLLGFQNAYALGDDIDALEAYVDQGVRVVGLAHAGHNAFADSSRPRQGEPVRHGGLSPLGEEAVRRLNQRGAVIDVSQLTPEGVLQTVALSRAPVVASHSNARALVDNARNLSDAELDAIGAAGGVVHVTPFNAYLAPVTPAFRARAAELREDFGLSASFRTPHDDYGLIADPARRDAFLDALAEAYPKAGVPELVDHIDHIVARIGIEHVGIGSDFDHGAGIEGYADAADSPNVTRELLRRGYSDADIARIWSGNFLRVFRAVEQAAAP